MNKDRKYTKEIFLYAMQNTTDLLAQQLTSNKMLIPVIGNHDYFPKNQLPGDHIEIYERIGEMWKNWLPGDALTAFKNGRPLIFFYF